MHVVQPDDDTGEPNVTPDPSPLGPYLGGTIQLLLTREVEALIGECDHDSTASLAERALETIAADLRNLTATVNETAGHAHITGALCRLAQRAETTFEISRRQRGHVRGCAVEVTEATICTCEGDRS